MSDIVTRVVLDEEDTGRLLRMLYNGECPEKVHTLICACGALADLWTSPKAWNGWQVLPFAKCPTCLEKAWCAAVLMENYEGPARAEFFLRLRQLLEEG